MLDEFVGFGVKYVSSSICCIDLSFFFLFSAYIWDDGLDSCITIGE